MSIKPIGYVSTGTPDEVKADYVRTRESLDRMCTNYPRATAVKHVWEIEEGFFVYSDETENFSDNIYTSMHDAEIALNAYGDWLCKEPEGVIYE